MERFRASERESKTKAFSKEGLARARQKLDPAESKRIENRDTLNNYIEQLRQMYEELEAEVRSYETVN